MVNAAKNINNVGLKSPGGAKNSLGTVSGLGASDVTIFTPSVSVIADCYDTLSRILKFCVVQLI
jgi:hypothetical protein